MRTLHVGLRVSDLGRSLAFYTAVGYTVVGTVEGTAFGSLNMLRLPGDGFVTIELRSDPLANLDRRGNGSDGSRLVIGATMIPFAFAGRVSTEDQQDPEASRAWQISRATALIEPHGGEIVAEHFDIGQSRSLPWPRRPKASLLLASLRDPDRGFADVVVGEPHRAFYGNQFGLTFPLFTHYGVRL